MGDIMPHLINYIAFWFREKTTKSEKQKVYKIIRGVEEEEVATNRFFQLSHNTRTQGDSTELLVLKRGTVLDNRF